MNDILEDMELSKKRSRAVFSKIAFCFSILSLILMTLVINVTPVVRAWVGGFTIVSMVLGLVFTIISLMRKEKIKHIKKMAAIVNIGLFVVIGGLMIFSLMIGI